MIRQILFLFFSLFYFSVFATDWRFAVSSPALPPADSLPNEYGVVVPHTISGEHIICSVADAAGYVITYKASRANFVYAWDGGPVMSFTVSDMTAPAVPINDGVNLFFIMNNCVGYTVYADGQLVFGWPQENDIYTQTMAQLNAVTNPQFFPQDYYIDLFDSEGNLIASFFLGRLEPGETKDLSGLIYLTPEQYNLYYGPPMGRTEVHYQIPGDWWEDHPEQHATIDTDGDGYIDLPWPYVPQVHYPGDWIDGPLPTGPGSPSSPASPSVPAPGGSPASGPNTPIGPVNPGGGGDGGGGGDDGGGLDVSGIVSGLQSVVSAVQSVGAKAAAVGDKISAMANALVGEFVGLGNRIVSGVASVLSGISGLGDRVAGLFTSIGNGIATHTQSLLGKLAGIGDSINSGLAQLLDGISHAGSGNGMGEKIDGVKGEIEKLGEKIDGGESGGAELVLPDVSGDDPDTQPLLDSASQLLGSSRGGFVSDWLHGFFSLSLPTSVGKNGSLSVSFGHDFCGASALTCDFSSVSGVADVRTFLAGVIGILTVFSAVQIYKGTF
jgi:hypothetical protein